MSILTNIFQNEFYEHPVLPNWSWEVSINEHGSAPDELMEQFTKAASKISIPDLQLLTTQTQFRGLTFDIPTRLDNTGEFSITFNENSELSLYKALKTRLLRTSFNEAYIKDEYSDSIEALYSPVGLTEYVPFDIYVKLLDPRPHDTVDDKQHIRYALIFRNCFVTDINDADLAYDSQEILEYTVKFHYNFRLEGNDAQEFLKKELDET